MADTPQPQTDVNLPSQSGKELGASGTYMFNGFITGEEYNRDLKGDTGLKTYDTMRRSDPTVHASMLVCKNPIIAADWSVQPASDEPQDREIADFVSRELFDQSINWPDTVRQALTALDFGYCVFEIVLCITDFDGQPRIGLQKLGYRKQRSIMSWSIKDDKPGIRQYIVGKAPVDIPRDKLVYVVNEQEGDNYEGISLLRFAYKPWKMKDALEIMHCIALERMSLGIPIIRKGENGQTVTEEELERARQLLRNMRNNEEAYLELPAGITIEMLEMKANQVKDALPTIQHFDRQILLSILAQFLDLGSSGSGGSRALSEDQTSLYIKALEAVARTVQQAFQNDLVKKLVDLNYSNLKNGYPKLSFSNLSDSDIAELSEAINKLMSVKALTPDRDLENSLRTTMNVPLLPKEIYDSYGNKADIPETIPEDTPSKTADDNDEAIDDAKKEEAAIARARAVQADLLHAILGD